MNPPFLRATIPSLTLAAFIGGPAAAASVPDKEAIAATVKAEVREIVTGINTQNADLATAHDSPNVAGMGNDQPNSLGAAADASGFKKAFASDKSWRVSLVEETVDVAEAGDMAIYRSIYNQDGTQAKVPVTQRVNFVSGWSRSAKGDWTMDWYVVSEIEKPHKK